MRKPAEQPVLREDWHENEDGSRLLLLKYPLLERTGIVEHCFTTRLGGVSTDIFSTMNLSFTRGDEEAAKGNSGSNSERSGRLCERKVRRQWTKRQ